MKRRCMQVVRNAQDCDQKNGSNTNYQQVLTARTFTPTVNPTQWQTTNRQSTLLKALGNFHAIHIAPQGRHEQSGHLYTFWTVTTMRPPPIDLHHSQVDLEAIRIGTKSWYEPERYLKCVIKVSEDTGKVVVMTCRSPSTVMFEAQIPNIANDAIDIEVSYPPEKGKQQEMIGTIKGRKFTDEAFQDTHIVHIPKWPTDSAERANLETIERGLGGYFSVQFGKVVMDGIKENDYSTRQAAGIRPVVTFTPRSGGIGMNFGWLDKHISTLRALGLMYGLKKAYSVYRYHELPLPNGLLHMNTMKSTQPPTTPAVLQYLLSSITELRIRPACYLNNTVWVDLIDYNDRVVFTATYPEDHVKNQGSLEIFDNFGKRLYYAQGLPKDDPLQIYSENKQMVGEVVQGRFLDPTGTDIMNEITVDSPPLVDYYSEKLWDLEEMSFVSLDKGYVRKYHMHVPVARELLTLEIHRSQPKQYKLASIVPEDATTKLDILPHLSLNNNWKAMMIAYSLKVAITHHDLNRYPVECRGYVFLR